VPPVKVSVPALPISVSLPARHRGCRCRAATQDIAATTPVQGVITGVTIETIRVTGSVQRIVATRAFHKVGRRGITEKSQAEQVTVRRGGNQVSRVVAVMLTVFRRPTLRTSPPTYIEPRNSLSFWLSIGPPPLAVNVSVESVTSPRKVLLWTVNCRPNSVARSVEATRKLFMPTNGSKTT